MYEVPNDENELSERDMTRLDETLNVEDTLSFMKRVVSELEELRAENESLRSEVEKHKRLSYPSRGLGKKPFAITAETKVGKCNRHATPSEKTAWAEGKWMKVNSRGNRNALFVVDKNNKTHLLVEAGISIHPVSRPWSDSFFENERSTERYLESFARHNNIDL